MRKIGAIIFFIGLLSFCYFQSVENYRSKQSQEEIEKYIEETKVIEKEIEIEEEGESSKTESRKELNYTAIIEIPSIDLRNGLVDSTANFKSINYAISVDKISQYPDQNGNFILYAHSGSSYISFFKNLNKVNINDEVYIYYQGYKYVYKIFDKYEIEKTGEMNVVNSPNKRIITLLTCKSGTDKQIVILGENIGIERY